MYHLQRRKLQLCGRDKAFIFQYVQWRAPAFPPLYSIKKHKFKKNTVNTGKNLGNSVLRYIPIPALVLTCKVEPGLKRSLFAEPMLALKCSSLATSVRAHIQSQNSTVLGQKGAATYFSRPQHSFIIIIIIIWQRLPFKASIFRHIKTHISRSRNQLPLPDLKTKFCKFLGLSGNVTVEPNIYW